MTSTLVSEETFATARSAAAATRVRRHILWQFASESDCYIADDSDDSDLRMKWIRITAQPTLEPIKSLIAKAEHFGDHYTWLLTEEHHDVLGNFYTIDGGEILPSWQPDGPGLLRTADNPGHWISVKELHVLPFMAPIAVSEASCPADWNQPRKPHYQTERDVWVHFTDRYGPFYSRNVLTKIQAPRRTTDAMRIFLKHSSETPSAADMLMGVLKHINAFKLTAAGDSQTVIPDDTLKALLSVSEPFRLTELQTLLEPHHGPFV